MSAQGVTQSVKDYFCRHFLGKLDVHSLLLAVEPPTIHSSRRNLETHPVRTRMNVIGSAFFSLTGLNTSSQGFRFSEQMVGVRGAKIARYAPGEIATHTLPPLKLRLVKKNDLRRMLLFPQERTNRLRWQSVRPNRDGEVLLAWFGPIVEDAVSKMTLNKQQGTLLIWYNSQSRRFIAKGVYLYRRFVLGENLEWRWL